MDNILIIDDEKSLLDLLSVVFRFFIRVVRSHTASRILFGPMSRVRLAEIALWSKGWDRYFRPAESNHFIHEVTLRQFLLIGSE